MRISDWSSDVCSSDLVAEGRGGRSALLRTVLQQSLKHVADAPRIPPRADSPSNRVNLRFTDVETAVLDHRAAQRGVDRAGWIKALVRRHLALKAGVDDGLRDAVAPIRMPLTRIGRNLNQPMKAGNAAMMADSGLQIDRELRMIADMRQAIKAQIAEGAAALLDNTHLLAGAALICIGTPQTSC